MGKNKLLPFEAPKHNGKQSNVAGPESRTCSPNNSHSCENTHRQRQTATSEDFVSKEGEIENTPKSSEYTQREVPTTMHVHSVQPVASPLTQPSRPRRQKRCFLESISFVSSSLMQKFHDTGKTGDVCILSLKLISCI